MVAKPGPLDSQDFWQGTVAVVNLAATVFGNEMF